MLIADAMALSALEHAHENSKYPELVVYVMCVSKFVRASVKEVRFRFNVRLAWLLVVLLIFYFSDVTMTSNKNGQRN